MSQELKYWYLKNHKLFSQLKEENVRDLSVISEFIKARCNAVIHLPRTSEKTIYVLKQGIIKITQHDDTGKDKTVDIIEAGDFFGEIGSPNNDSKNQFATVLTEQAIICTFTFNNFKMMLEKNPSIAINYVTRLEEKILKIQSRYTDLVFKDVKTRLIEFLQKFSMTHGEVGDNNSFVVKNYLTHEIIAELIGCKRQTVSSLMQELASENKIKYTRSYLVLYNCQDSPQAFLVSN